MPSALALAPRERVPVDAVLNVLGENSLRRFASLLPSCTPCRRELGPLRGFPPVGRPDLAATYPCTDLDDPKELQWLYSDEVVQLLSCEEVPVDMRRAYALCIYLFLRGGDLKALSWDDVDTDRGIVSVRRSFDRETGELKKTKTGNKGMRRFAIEPTLLPLLRAVGEAIGDLFPELPKCLQVVGTTVEAPGIEPRRATWRKLLRNANLTRISAESFTNHRPRRFRSVPRCGTDWCGVAAT